MIRGLVNGCIAITFSLAIIQLFFVGCAQIGMPTGGPKDTLAPAIVKAVPADGSLQFNQNKIILNFDEYIELKDLQNNLLISPLPQKTPEINFKLKTVTIKLKDSLLENTTYSINFGNSIVDNNEGNPLKNYSYVFSTGNHLDSLSILGKVIVAETGKVDSTIIALLYKNLSDTAVSKLKPDYLARLKGDGTFSFHHLPEGNYHLYALKDGDGSKTYNSTKEMFGFLNEQVVSGLNGSPHTIYAFAEEKELEKKPTAPVKNAPVKSLKYVSSIMLSMHDINKPLTLQFDRRLQKADLRMIQLTDSNYAPIKNVAINIDSSNTLITLNTTWKENEIYKLLIPKEALADSLKLQIFKSDSITFKTKGKEDYGNLLVRFNKLDTSKHPILQLTQNEKIVYSIPILNNKWSQSLMDPGEYEVKIIYDSNNNGQLDPGNFKLKLQPEKAIILDKKLSLRANWDNEREIEL